MVWVFIFREISEVRGWSDPEWNKLQKSAPLRRHQRVGISIAFFMNPEKRSSPLQEAVICWRCRRVAGKDLSRGCAGRLRPSTLWSHPGPLSCHHCRLPEQTQLLRPWDWFLTSFEVLAPTAWPWLCPWLPAFCVCRHLGAWQAAACWALCAVSGRRLCPSSSSTTWTLVSWPALWLGQPWPRGKPWRIWAEVTGHSEGLKFLCVDWHLNKVVTCDGYRDYLKGWAREWARTRPGAPLQLWPWCYLFIALETILHNGNFSF